MVGKIIRWFLFAVLLGFVIAAVQAVFSEWFIELAKERGLYDEPSSRLATAMSVVSAFISEYWLVLSGIFVLGATVGAWIHHLANRYDRRSIDVSRTDWERERKALEPDRRAFAESALAAYEKWQGKPDMPLRKVVRGAVVPDGWPKKGVRFEDWVRSINFREGDHLLMAFAQQLYPTSDKPMGTRTKLLTKKAFDEFDDARKSLSKFWDDWGRLEPQEQVIKTQRAEELVGNQSWEIKLLVYLEMAREIWAEGGASGKSGLFRLAQRNDRLGY